MRYFLPYSLAALPAAGLLIGGVWIYIVTLPAFALLILLDLALGEMPPPRPERRWINMLPVWLWPLVQWALIAWVLWEIGRERLTPLEAIGMALSVGFVTGAVGFTAAHELIHRRALAERWLGQILLTSVTFDHYSIEHVFGHHRRAGTAADSVTARRGESLYLFLPRAIARSFDVGWQIEAKRLVRAGHGPWSWRNRVLRGFVAEAALYAVIAVFAGYLGVIFFAIQSITAIVMLEIINYVEHYGLARREMAPGVYERYSARHAWDSRFRFSNWLLFNLPSHSNHHLHPGRRHDELVFEPAAPRLPVGYSLAFVLALLPPLWFRVADPILAKADAGCV